MKTTIFACICAGLGILLGVATARVQLGKPTLIVVPRGEAAALRSSQPTPQVAVDEDTYDFGSMERHSSHSHEFLFTNIGDAPLRLTVGETSCKCTIGHTPDEPIGPGESVPVKLSWSVDTDESQFRQNATIHTNDPLRETVRLTVMGKVTEVSSYHPHHFLFGDVPLGSSRSAEVKVVSSRDETFDVLGYSLIAPASDEHFDVEVEELPKEEFPSSEVQSGKRIRVTTLPSLPLGLIRGSLKVRTNLERIAELEIPLAGKVVSEFSITGGGSYDSQRDVLNLGRVLSDAGAERRLLVFVRGELAESVEVSVAETFPAFLEAEVGERRGVGQSGGEERAAAALQIVQFPLAVRVPQGAPPAVHMGGQDSQLGRIILHTTHPNVPELTIHVRFTVE